MKQKYSQGELRSSLGKLRKKLGRFNLSLRYDRDTKNAKEHKQINKVFKKFGNKNVIDIGCHIGYYSTLISSFAESVVGIDIRDKSIKQANYFKEIMKVDNTEFKTKSAFDIDDNFMKNHNINAVFIHKSVGIEGTNTYWSDENFEQVFSLLAKHCDTVVCNRVERIKDIFVKKGFSVKESPSYRSNIFYLIEKEK